MNEFVRQLLNFGMADILNENEAPKVESYLVAAGDPASSMPHYDHLIELEDSVRKGRKQFAVCGNSMSPLGIDDGDNVLANDFNTNNGDIREGDFLIVEVDPTYYEGERPNFEYKLRCAIMVVEESWSEEMIVNRLKQMDSQAEIWLKSYRNCLHEKYVKAKRHYNTGRLVLSATYKNGTLRYSFHRIDFVKYKAEAIVKQDTPETLLRLAA